MFYYNFGLLIKNYSALIGTSCFLGLSYELIQIATGIGAWIGHDMDWLLSASFLVVAVSPEITF